jgi:hypothetical protein
MPQSDDIEILNLCHRLLQLTNHSQTQAFILLSPDERDTPIVISNVGTDQVPILFSNWIKGMNAGTVQ